MFNSDLHLHLYGCLRPIDLWSLGRDRYREQETRLAWYAEEYHKAYGRCPKPAAYWERDDGLELLSRDFLFMRAAPFAHFQACFNLAIALFPARAEDTLVLEQVLRTQRQEGVAHAEYRSFLPPQLSGSELAAYIVSMASKAAAIEGESGGSFVPRLAFSLSRLPALGLKQYEILHTILLERPDLARVVTGLDFCGVEEGHPPSLTAPLLASIQRGNAAAPAAALAILFHVGESFRDKTLMSAARWVWQAHTAGAHRLGHALALAQAPEALSGQDVTEPLGERRAHLLWLREAAPWLRERGYPVDLARTASELEGLNSLAETPNIASASEAAVPLTFTYTPELVDDCRRLQDALLADLAARGAIVESCPTSNLRIGQLAAEHHPLRRFLAAGLTTVLASDDPGILATSLRGEAEIARQSLGLDTSELASLQAAAARCRSEQLVRGGL